MKLNQSMLLIVGLMSAMSNVSADVNIDTFNSYQFGVVSNPAPSSFSSLANSVDIIGLERLIQLTKITGSGGFINAAAFEVTGGTLSIANGPSTNSILDIVWDGIGTSGFGPVDFTEGGLNDALRFGLPAVLDKDITMTFNINDGASTLTTTFLAGTSSPSLYANFQDFSNATVFTNVSKIAVQISSTSAWDAEFQLFSSSDNPDVPNPPPPTPLPEPGTLMLLGLGLLGLAAITRKHKK